MLPCHALHAAGVRFRWQQTERFFKAFPEPWFVNFLPATLPLLDLFQISPIEPPMAEHELMFSTDMSLSDYQ